MIFDQKDSLLLERLQDGMPLTENPYREIGKALNLSWKEVIARVWFLKDELKVIREMGGIFNSRSLGYYTALVGSSYPLNLLDKAADIINPHPGVTHNYIRDHTFNLWYTISSSSFKNLKATVNYLANLSKPKDILILPPVQVYKLRLLLGSKFEVREIQETSLNSYSSISLSEDEFKVGRVLQEDFPICRDPFKVLAEKASLKVSDFLKLTERLMELGVLRRIGAIVYPSKLGFKENVMVCWYIKDEEIKKHASFAASFKEISHCYVRECLPRWPYQLYTVIHTKTSEETNQIIEKLSFYIKPKDYQVLRSLKEYKKARPRLFNGEIESWERRIGFSK
jgi:DNA-binding Lrp family transcriptional regulator